MSTAIDSLPLNQRAAASNTPLWAAVGLLSTAVLAMGGTMLYRQGAQSAVAATPVSALVALQPAAVKPAVLQASSSAEDDLIEKPVPPVKKVVKPVSRPAPAPHYSAVSPAPRPATYSSNYPSSQPSSQAASLPVSYPQASVCGTCGSVESVTAVERASKPGPVSVGSVAGGVLGAVLGNQVGHGNGRALATVIGAVGGGFAGHAIEGQVRKDTVYQVGVRMEDGSRRTVEASSAPAVGGRVTVDGNVLRDRQGASDERRAAPIPVAYSQPAFESR